MVRNKIPSVFLFCKMIQKGIPNIVHLPSTWVFSRLQNGSELYSEHFSLFGNGSERNYFKFRCFLFTKSFKIRRKNQNFRFSLKMATLLLLSDHLLDFFTVLSRNNKWLKSVSFFRNISLGRRMFLNEKGRNVQNSTWSFKCIGFATIQPDAKIYRIQNNDWSEI